MLLNQTQFHSPKKCLYHMMSYMQQSQSIDSGLWWREVQCLLQGTKQGNGRQASDPLPPGLWGFLFCFVLRGRTKRLGLIIVLGHFFNQSFRRQDVSGLWFSGQVTRGSWLWGSVSSSHPGETTWVCTFRMIRIQQFLYIDDVIDNSSFSHLILVDCVVSTPTWSQRLQERE